ncbi:hypothetical protein HJG60_008783 [Phyllostomus discolor]|uniref:Uncharacterized protein n=1 Tax=Phyllostomus discolor TaxID=89673 RepID=A0A833YWH1_9CHIR|nr:hypothetical protein HJG60_008783 [Phyllostomus discolor]
MSRPTLCLGNCPSPFKTQGRREASGKSLRVLQGHPLPVTSAQHLPLLPSFSRLESSTQASVPLTRPEASHLSCCIGIYGPSPEQRRCSRSVEQRDEENNVPVLVKRTRWGETGNDDAYRQGNRRTSVCETGPHGSKGRSDDWRVLPAGGGLN